MEKEKAVELTALMMPHLEAMQSKITEDMTLSVSITPKYISVIFHEKEHDNEEYDRVLNTVSKDFRGLHYESTAWFKNDEMVKHVIEY